MISAKAKYLFSSYLKPRAKARGVVNCMRIVIIFTFFFSSILFAQSDFYQLGGYVKYLYSNADLPLTGHVNDHLIHARINSRLYVSDNIRAGIELRNRIFYGGSVEKTPNFLSTTESYHDLGNADVVWWDANSSAGLTELDRMWIDATYNKLQVTVGRQRIAFGTALVWNPVDLFNPLSILDFDYEERPGVDAVRIQYYTGDVSKVEVAIKPGKTRSGNVVAAKLLFNRWDYDFHILGGIRAYKPFVGFAWAGDIEGAGFRGECLSSQIDDNAAALYPSLADKWSSSYCLSGDYTFPSSLYIHTEVLYNDRGVTQYTALAYPRMQSLHLLSPAKWSLFQEVSYDVHPLVHVSGFVIHNPNDASSAYVPSVTWSAFENIDLSFFGLIFAGNSLSEYGSYGTSFFIRGKYSF